MTDLGRSRKRFLALTLAAGLVLLAGCAPSSPGAASGAVTILGAAPVTLDPAAQGDIGSAQVTAQLFETLTAFDASLTIQPALASGWLSSNGGRTITFSLRPNLTFSDGSALTAADVVRSWLRLLNPAHPSPLASLLDEIHGARAYLGGQTSDPSSVGLKAEGNSVVVTFDSPATDFPALVSGPSFGIVPASIDDPATLTAGSFVGSGGIPAGQADRFRADPDRQQGVLGRTAADRHDPPADHDQRPEPGRGLRGRHARLHPHRPVRRFLDPL